jgi:hypothetical protein
MVRNFDLLNFDGDADYNIEYEIIDGEIQNYTVSYYDIRGRLHEADGYDPKEIIELIREDIRES